VCSLKRQEKVRLYFSCSAWPLTISDMTDKGPKGAKAASIIVSIVLGFATDLAFRYILKKMAAVKNDVIYRRRKDR
jgi:hypothetical protein